jgi:ATP phosphoribosyltransferase
VARVYNVEEEDWFNVSLLVQKERLLEAVDHLRDCGAVDVAASQLSYLFDGGSQAYQKLFGEGPTRLE